MMQAGETTPEFPINEALLEEATHAKEEWRVIRDRLAKIDEHKENVSEAVHRKVHADYEKRLSDAKQELLAKKAEIDRELQTLYATREKINGQLAEHQQALEEIKFRNTLGEFQAEEYQKAAREEQEKISKFESILSAVGNNVARYESIFEGEEELFAKQEPQPAADEISQVGEISGVTTAPDIPRAPANEPETDAQGFIQEEGGPDYFSAATDADRTNPEVSQPAAPEAAAPAAESDAGHRSRVVIINGDNAGAGYPVKGTLSFGRADANTVTLKDAKVSRQHAQIQQQGKEFILIDLNSSNGTFVNGERIEEHVLANGDEIQIGDVLLQFQI